MFFDYTDFIRTTKFLVGKCRNSVEVLFGNFIGTEFKRIWIVSFPLILGGFLSCLMTLIDAVYLSYYSQDAFQAIVLVIPFVNLSGAVAGGIATAISNSISKKKNQSDILNELIANQILNFIITSIVVYISYRFSKSIYSYYNLTEHSELSLVYLHFKSYWLAIIPGFVFLYLATIMIQIFVSMQKTKIANLIILVMTVLNIVLNPVFIFYFSYGTAGAAIGTSITFLVGTILCVVVFLKKREDFIFLVSIKKIKDSFFEQVGFFILIFFSMAIWAVNGIIFNDLALKSGRVFLVALGVFEQIQSIFGFISRGVCAGFLIIFNQVISRKETDKYFCTLVSASLICEIFYLVGAVISIVLYRFIFSLFDITDIEIEKQTRFFLIIGSILMLLSGLPRIVQIAFISLNAPIATFLMSILMVGFSYLCTVHLYDLFGAHSLVFGKLLGYSIVFIMFVPFCFWLIAKRIKIDSMSG